tara:strand:- start:1156 stop:1311 length:156 start_codon:yes stop_codon:yes gene_type:complete
VTTLSGSKGGKGVGGAAGGAGCGRKKHTTYTKNVSLLAIEWERVKGLEGVK